MFVFLKRFNCNIPNLMLTTLAALGLSHALYAEVEISIPDSEDYIMAASGDYAIATWLAYDSDLSQQVQMASVYHYTDDTGTWSTPVPIPTPVKQITIPLK